MRATNSLTELMRLGSLTHERTSISLSANRMCVHVRGKAEACSNSERLTGTQAGQDVRGARGQKEQG